MARPPMYTDEHKSVRTVLPLEVIEALDQIVTANLSSRTTEIRRIICTNDEIRRVMEYQKEWPAEDFKDAEGQETAPS